MTDINFYQLSHSSLEKALITILEKILASQKRALIVADTPERLTDLNNALWTYSPGSFLPHGTLDDGRPEMQPVLLTTEFTNHNQAQYLIAIDGVEIPDATGYEKCLDIFNSADQSSVVEARVRWKKYKEQGHNLIYWYQDDKGSWQQK